ncbi:MAG: hypothetical protein U5J83_01435 [Bryobacterales bacterium]|nr:hypothetical protein [Bryobacterales bacterium]
MASSRAAATCPGLNSVIKGVVYRGSEHDIEVVGIAAAGEASPM